MFAVTGASGHFGRLVLDALIAEVPASQVVALARDPAKVSDCSKAGVVVRLLNYNEEETLRPALAGVERLLFISGSEHGSSHVDGRHRLSLGDNGNGRFKGKNADRGASGTTRF